MKKVRVVNKKNLSTMIVGVVTIAIVVVCVFLYVSRPTEIDKLSQSYLDTVDVEKLQKKVETSFDGSYRLSDYPFSLYHTHLYIKMSMVQRKWIKCKAITLF